MSYHVTVLGGGGTGKSTLTIRYCLGHFVEHYDPTIEDTYRMQANVDDKAEHLMILDTAGQEDYSMLRDTWMRNGDGFLVCFSVTDSKSFAELDGFVEGILRVKDVDSATNLPIVLVATKIDLVDQRVVSTEDLHAKAAALKCVAVETSAVSEIGVSEAFAEVVRRHRHLRPGIESSSGSSDRPRGGRLLSTKCIIL